MCQSITSIGKTTEDTWPADGGSIKSSPYVQGKQILRFFSFFIGKSLVIFLLNIIFTEVEGTFGVIISLYS